MSEDKGKIFRSTVVVGIKVKFAGRTVWPVGHKSKISKIRVKFAGSTVVNLQEVLVGDKGKICR